MIPLPLLACSALLCATFGAAASYKLTAEHYQAAAAREQQEAAEAYQARTVELNQVSAELERARREKKVIYRTITQRVEKYIDRPIYLRDCADDDGLRDEDAALTRGTYSRKPAPAVPGPDADGGQDRR